MTDFDTIGPAGQTSRVRTADAARVARTYDRMRSRHRGESAEQIAPYIKTAWGRIGHRLTDAEAMAIATSVSQAAALKTRTAPPHNV